VIEPLFLTNLQNLVMETVVVNCLHAFSEKHLKEILQLSFELFYMNGDFVDEEIFLPHWDSCCENNFSILSICYFMLLVSISD